jgi:protoporphyrinogen/coproporphyrinogen III oxidase
VTLHVPVLIVGGGVSGLVCAHALRQAGVEALVVEASGRPGGAIRTERRDGYLLELGPQSFSGTAPLLKLISDLGIEDEMLQAPPHAPRYVLVDGKLRRVPLNPPAFLTSGLVGLKTKWAIARDLLGNSKPPEQDESVGAFVRRKFSAELLDRLVGPFVSGVYAGDPERLSLRSAFPTLYEAENSKGSVLRGLRAKSSQERTQRPTLLSFREGSETLIRALAASFGERLRSGVEVVQLEANRMNADERAFSVTARSASQQETLSADHVVIATPTDVAGKLLRTLEANFERLLATIEYAPIAVVSLGYRRIDIGHALDGFGFLVPRSAGLRTLGTVWNSSLFQGRAPENHVLLTSFVGGATDPQVAALPHGELTSLVQKEIGPVLEIRQDARAGRNKPRPREAITLAPSFWNVTIYPRALPQYNVGHADRLAAVEQQRGRHPNLWLAGNYLRGPSIGACVEQSLSVAQEILSRMKSKR